VTQPLFQGGQLLHKKRAAEATYEQAFAQYRNVVLSAFQNVADALHALNFDAQALATAVEAERSTLESLNIARKQMELGDVSYLSLLTAEQAYQQARLTVVQTRANRLADTAALFQALGGGWSDTQ
jgi:outer membrane protein TolC